MIDFQRIIAFVLLVICGTSAFLFAASLILFNVLGYPVRYKRSLRRLAKQDYASARGTLHKKMLIQAKPRLIRAIQLETGYLSQEKQKLDHLTKEFVQNLNRAYLEFSLSIGLDRISGLRPEWKEQLIASCRSGRLQDIYDTSLRIKDLSVEVRYFILHFIQHFYTITVQEILKSEFPEKDRIVQEFNHNKAAIEQRITDLTASRQRHLAQLEKLKSELDRLTLVQESDFLQMWEGKVDKSNKLEAYLRGVFAEWETPPDWFQEAVIGNDFASSVVTKTLP